jgi:hypothetical protein
VCAEGVGAEHARFQRNLQASAVGRTKLYRVGGHVAVLGSIVLSMHTINNPQVPNACKTERPA